MVAAGARGEPGGQAGRRRGQPVPGPRGDRRRRARRARTRPVAPRADLGGSRVAVRGAPARAWASAGSRRRWARRSASSSARPCFGGRWATCCSTRSWRPARASGSVRGDGRRGRRPRAPLALLREREETDGADRSLARGRRRRAHASVPARGPARARPGGVRHPRDVPRRVVPLVVAAPARASGRSSTRSPGRRSTGSRCTGGWPSTSGANRPREAVVEARAEALRADRVGVHEGAARRRRRGRGPVRRGVPAAARPRREFERTIGVRVHRVARLEPWILVHRDGCVRRPGRPASRARRRRPPADPNCVAFKSIVAYRTGLDVGDPTRGRGPEAFERGARTSGARPASTPSRSATS